MFNWGGYGHYRFMKLSLRTLLKCNQVNLHVHWTLHMFSASWNHSLFTIFCSLPPSFRVDDMNDIIICSLCVILCSNCYGRNYNNFKKIKMVKNLALSSGTPSSLHHVSSVGARKRKRQWIPPECTTYTCCDANSALMAVGGSEKVLFSVLSFTFVMKRHN